MKKVKNLLAFMVCISTCTALFTGCIPSDSSSSDKEIVDVSTSEDSQVSGAFSKDEDNSSKKDESSEDTKKDEESSEDTKKDVTITESVIVNQDGIVITAKKLDEGFLGTELTILIENNTDKDLTFQVRDASVNGFMVDTMISEDVAAGKKSNTEITFSDKKLKACGVDTLADIEFSFCIFTSDDWKTYLDTAPIEIETSAASDYKQQIDDSGTVLYDNKGIKIIGKKLSTDDSIFGPGLVLYIENNSNQNITVQSRDTSVNGFMVSTVLSEDVLIGKKSITSLTFMESSLEENDITDIETVETSFHVVDADNWRAIVDTDPITIEFE